MRGSLRLPWSIRSARPRPASASTEPQRRRINGCACAVEDPKRTAATASRRASFAEQSRDPAVRHAMPRPRAGAGRIAGRRHHTLDQHPVGWGCCLPDIRHRYARRSSPRWRATFLSLIVSRSATGTSPRAWGRSRRDVHRQSTALSPRLRGSPRYPGWCRAEVRCIPACAGGGLDCPPSFEPRLCCIPVRAGKIVSRARFALKAQWCIPACAGQTKTTPDDLMAIWVHPRACGAAMRYDEADERRRGSSPRMRGLLRNRAVAGVSAGLIPARAGGLTAAPATAPAGSLPRLRLWCRPRRTGRSSIPVDSGSFQAGCAIRARLMSRVGYAVS